MPGLTSEEVKRRTVARAFCAEAGRLLYSHVEADSTPELLDDGYLANIYASHLLGRNGLMGEDASCLEHLLGCTMDPNDDHFALQIEDLDPNAFDSIHLQFVSADDVEYDT